MADAPDRAAVARLFIALWPDDAVREALVARQRAWHWPRGAARTAAPRLHATLHFLGDVARERLPALQDALRVPMGPFELTLDRDERWSGGLAVLAASQQPSELLDLHATLATVLQAQGLRSEHRPYRAHVTLARRAAGASPPATASPIRWAIDAYELVESRLPGGYERLARVA